MVVVRAKSLFLCLPDSTNIKGWTEGIQLMNEGSEYEFFIHPRLAYGARRNNDIPPNSVLIFKVELQKVFDKNIK